MLIASGLSSRSLPVPQTSTKPAANQTIPVKRVASKLSMPSASSGITRRAAVTP